MVEQYSFRSVALFVTSHGFGHASRACAVAKALTDIRPEVRFEIFSSIPQWYFSGTLDDFRFHQLNCDIGLVQHDALNTDIPGTLKALADELPFKTTQINALANKLTDTHCELVICDIAPMGIAVARAAGLPSVLIENFTWDWIYRSLAQGHPAFLTYADALEQVFTNAKVHIQTQPVCNPVSSAIHVNPIARSPRQNRDNTRKALGLQSKRSMVFLTMGGVPQEYPFVSRLHRDFSTIDFVIAGIEARKEWAAPNVRLLPANSSHYHPDLINAADAVIGKAGYSTIAEIYQSQVRFGYFVREDYPEMQALVNFLQHNTDGILLSAQDYMSGNWLSELENLLAVQPACRQQTLNGSLQVAQLVSELLSN